MSHQNPYISRDVDINAYVLQKDTAMSPYIVHMKTDVNVPKMLRTQQMQTKVDGKNRKKIQDKFRRKIDKLMEDMKSISAEGVKKIKELDAQLKRIETETLSNSDIKGELNDTKLKIEAFQAEVDRLQKATGNH
jgi:hypothetical protein